MALPESLAGRLYLLGCRTEPDRPPGGAEAALRLRAAVLAELWLAGLVVTDGGRPPGDPKGLVAVSTIGPQRVDPRIPSTPREITDPIVARAIAEPAASALLAEITASPKPRTWVWWVGHGEKDTARAVAEQLGAMGTIEVIRSRRWGVFGRHGVRLSEPGAVEQVRAGVRAALLGTVPVAELDRRDVVLAALAVAGNTTPLWERAERRAARDRLKELLAAAGPVPAALRKVIRDREAAIAGATTAAVVAGSSG